MRLINSSQLKPFSGHFQVEMVENPDTVDTEYQQYLSFNSSALKNCFILWFLVGSPLKGS